MITNPEILKKFEDNLAKNETVISHERSLNLLKSMWEEGTLLGVLPPSDPLEGIDTDIKVARILNSCLTESYPE